MKTYKIFLSANYTSGKVNRMEIIQSESLENAFNKAKEIAFNLDDRGNYYIVDIQEC